MPPIITVENLSKSYRISHKGKPQQSYSALRDVITNGLATVGRKLFNPFRASTTSSPLPHSSVFEDFFALQNVSFEINQGDRIGIIGRNGAGKSTLLKILSRITEPTSGRVHLRGRVASLLEVGTGFHPELSGRENIYLNGAILGMSRTEISRKFDEIVDFAEVEQFLDTPVKRYSSGMYVRLAFAVAAHLEPEILVVDEVLAVGDAQFQKKCLEKMEAVGKEGRTVLFVSHNMGSISVLCDRCILLENGKIRAFDDTQTTIALYNRTMEALRDCVVIEPSMRNRGDGRIKFLECSLKDREGNHKNNFLIGEDIHVEFLLESTYSGPMSFWLIIFDSTGRPLLSTHQRDRDIFTVEPGKYKMTYRTESVGLLPDSYHISAGAFDTGLVFLEWVDNCQSFLVLRCFANGAAFDGRWGAVNQPANWSISKA